MGGTPSTALAWNLGMVLGKMLVSIAPTPLGYFKG